MNYTTLIIPLCVISLLLIWYVKCVKAARPRLGTTQWIGEYINRSFCFARRRFPMEGRDALPLLLITFVYAVVAFVNLGDTKAPQSFQHFKNPDKSVTIDLGEEVIVGRVSYYTGLYTGEYLLEFSQDSSRWTMQPKMKQEYADLFKWMDAELSSPSPTVRYIRVTAMSSPMDLGELALFADSGEQYALSGGDALTDEQTIVPEESTYLNSTYFDEIYHARTAYEHLENVYPYEISHPPLGKLIIMAGISLFGMTPFGWRFMGTVFGILMLPIFYILLKNLFGKTKIAACGTIIFAFDFMHYVQTRIATIDTYGVFFIILMYLFMYHFVTSGYDAPFKKTALPLFLSGLFFGIGCACKWTAVYAGLGLLVIYAVYIVFRGRYWSEKREGGVFAAWLFKTLLLSALCFIIIPVAIYCLSYIPYGVAKGLGSGLELLKNKDYYALIWDNQKFMLNYHEHVTASHPYASKWWMWIVDARPILYYLKYYDDGTKVSFGAFNNPLVSWGGLLALGSTVWCFIKRRQGVALFVLVGYLSQLLPWLLISRVTFAYHYFPSTVFLVIAICYLMNSVLEREDEHWKSKIYGFTLAVVLVFIAYYPNLTGLRISTEVSKNLLKWFPSWPFA